MSSSPFLLLFAIVTASGHAMGQMVIECSHCKARYHYDESRFEGKSSKKIRCAKCQGVFEIRNPSAGQDSGDLGDTTLSRHVGPLPKPLAQAGVQPETSQQRARVEAESPPSGTAGLKKSGPEEVTGEYSLPRLTSRTTGANERHPLRLPDGLRLSLAVIEGPDAGRVFPIATPRVVIGRAGTDIVLNDRESSRSHAAIEVRELVVTVEDLGSTNGTIIGGELIKSATEIRNRSEFQIGSSTLMMIVTEED